MARGKKTGGKDFTPGGSPLSPGGRGPQWGTLIRRFMDAPANEDYAALAKEVGVCGQKEKATIRMAMIARAIKTYMDGSEKIVGSGDSARIVNERAGDPRILTALMDREDGKPTQPLEGNLFDLSGTTITIDTLNNPNSDGS